MCPLGEPRPRVNDAMRQFSTLCFFHYTTIHMTDLGGNARGENNIVQYINSLITCFHIRCSLNGHMHCSTTGGLGEEALLVVADSVLLQTLNILD